MQVRRLQEACLPAFLYNWCLVGCQVGCLLFYAPVFGNVAMPGANCRAGLCEGAR